MIEVTDLSLDLGERRVLEQVSFRVSHGESVALVGPNGSGKTSAIRCILGLLPYSGRITVGGHDAWREPVAARTLVGYLPQRSAFGDSTALEALRFTARLRGLDPKRALAALERVGLAAFAHERARTFSGGMQQRLALAVALLSDPPVLLFDEPTASLDRAGQKSFLTLAAELRGEGRTLVLASHRAEEIDQLADRVLELAGGRLVPERGSSAVLPFFPPGVAS
jgi:ABC-2 type transport system ATP-binding protein